MIEVHSLGDGRHLLKAQQVFPAAPSEVFPFFADARNLASITPANLGFHILTPPHELDSMREGLLIDYRIRVRGLPMRWRTRITRWEPPHVFADEQERGPYALWRHTHTFEPIRASDGRTHTRMTDTVEYRPPLGKWLGGLANRLFVRREVAGIFAYRQQAMRARFGAVKDHSSPASARPSGLTA